MASIQIIQGPDKGLSYELSDGEQVIGRLNSTVELSDGTVSRRHARISARNGRWLLEDLGSANGTFVNGVRIDAPTPLQRGDQVRCGSTLLVFGGGPGRAGTVDVDEQGNLVDAAIVATVPSNEDSVVIPTPEAGAEAIDSLRILYDLITELGSIFNIDQLLERTLDKAFEVLKADRGYALLIDENGKLTLKSSRVDEEVGGENQPPISRTIINEVVEKEVGVLSSNAMTDKRFAAGKSVHDFGIRSAVCVPIKGRERILGVIHVDCSVSQHTYSTEQLRLLTAIGYQAGLAIENVRLYESAVQSERLAAVGETVAFLSHHIKNLLQGLSSGIDLVEMAMTRDNLDKAKKSWPLVQRNLGRINELILNMLQFSKQREPLLEQVNVNFILSECIDLVTPKADEKSVAVLSEMDDLPPIAADSAGLHQAFLNLMQNAVDAVEPETGVVTIRSSYDSMERLVRAEIIDNGSGIEAGKLDEIFTPFWSSKGQKGTGLGLAVARKVFHEHRGDIEVDSAPGEGTTFTITLPARNVGEAGETAGPAR